MRIGLKKHGPSYRPFLIAFVLALVFIGLDLRNSAFLDPVRGVLRRVAAPVYQLASYPVTFTRWMGQQITPTESVRNENTALKAELFQARVRLLKLAELSAENTRLRGLLATPGIVDGHLQLADIIGTDNDPRRHIIFINKGSNDHVFPGQAVLDEHGVLGQVMDVYPSTAQVLLLSDKENAAAVLIERTGMRGVISGTGDSSLLNLEYVPNTADVKAGDRLVTSGLGARFPAGYPIGEIIRVNRPASNEFAHIDVKPYAQIEGGQQVMLLAAHPLKPVTPHE